MSKHLGKIIYENIPNIISILGVLPLALLLSEDGYQYLIPLIVYNNIMDDLDGILAVKLDLKSDFGAKLDNVCDAVSHPLFVMVIGMHYGGICALASLIASASIILRITKRLDPNGGQSCGSMTNELIRHTFFILLLSQFFEFQPEPFLVVTFALHAISMLAPFPMPYLLRSLCKTAKAVLLINILLIVAWLLPFTTPIIAGCFFFSYLYSFGSGWSARLRRVDVDDVSVPDQATAKTK